MSRLHFSLPGSGQRRIVEVAAFPRLLELKDTVDDVLSEHSAVGFYHAEVHPWYTVDAPRNCVEAVPSRA